MHFVIGLLILAPFALAFWLAFKVVNACIKKSDALRPLGILVSLLVGGGSIASGYFIGPIVGWFIMVLGGLLAVFGTLRSLTMTREEVELEELEEKLEKERKQQEQNWAKEEAKKMLEQGEIDDYESFNLICNILDDPKSDMKSFKLSWDLKELKKKQAKRQKRNQ